ncbi:DNA-processing protein DprA [Chryseolinea lacunae]|uniref:DNA-protecting protein DprA n=1 Tax=Chryseolinea lacunae TaxID=2801331 RepID=A0ABS1KZQ9_9BACT|nr:DNA-processing protein DprA [Chryseolinea lacunae]MBL0743796.1 DNA-protecting protein DprA [Chryseolinea lacunae]
MDQNRLSLLALHFIPGIGNQLIRQLISYCGSAERVFKTPRGKLMKIPGIGAVTADSIRLGKPFSDAEKEMQRAQKEDVTLAFFTDKNYPSRLKQIADAPSLLYCKGNINFETSKTIGIVGTRMATPYGKKLVEELMLDLAPHEPLIVSGLAYGIDIVAHRQALKNNMATVGVMGSGIDVMYPASHTETSTKMLKHGGLVTENPFGTRPDAHNFPARNRIIAGLSDALIVIEAAEKGGALITAEIANSYNKDVFAFPGNIGQRFSEGCNALIRSNKANLLTSVKDLEYIMNWSVGTQPEKKKMFFDADAYSADEQEVIKVLLENNRQLAIDDIGWRTGIAIGRLASVLLGLEFKNVLAPLPGKVYKLLE